MKKIAYAALVIGLLLIINSLVHSIYDLWQKQDLVTAAQKDLSREQAKNQKLKASLQYAQTPQFIEEQAHDKLFMGKAGETQVIFSDVPTGFDISKQKTKEPNWKQWLDLFL
jgi:cell division protein FtsB